MFVRKFFLQNFTFFRVHDFRFQSKSLLRVLFFRKLTASRRSEQPGTRKTAGAQPLIKSTCALLLITVKCEFQHNNNNNNFVKFCGGTRRIARNNHTRTLAAMFAVASAITINKRRRAPGDLANARKTFA